MSLPYPSSHMLFASQIICEDAQASVNPAAYIDSANEVCERMCQRWRMYAAAAVTVTVAPSLDDMAAIYADLSTVDGSLFKTTTGQDAINGALAAVKGDVLAVGDVFRRAGAGVAYVGNELDLSAIAALFA